MSKGASTGMSARREGGVASSRCLPLVMKLTFIRSSVCPLFETGSRSRLDKIDCLGQGNLEVVLGGPKENGWSSQESRKEIEEVRLFNVTEGDKKHNSPDDLVTLMPEEKRTLYVSPQYTRRRNETLLTSV